MRRCSRSGVSSNSGKLGEALKSATGVVLRERHDVNNVHANLNGIA